jgi:hypothetical protein
MANTGIRSAARKVRWAANYYFGRDEMIPARGAQSNFDLAANAPNLSLSEAGLHNLVHAVFKAPQGSQLVSGVLSLHSRSPANLPAIKFNVHASLLVHIILNSHNIGK